MVLRLLGIGLALSLSSARAQTASKGEIAFEAKLQPFLPRLLVSHDTTLCDAFLRALQKDFLAQHRGDDTLFTEPPMTVGNWMSWPSGQQIDRTGIQFAELDLDKNGKKQLLIQVTEPFNWAGNWYSLLARPTTTTDDLANEIAAFGKLQPSEQQKGTLKIVARADLPALWRWGVYDGFKSPFRVLSYERAAYLYTFIDGIMGHGHGELKAGTASLQRIHADGTLDLQCQASVLPRAGALPLPSWLGDSNPPDMLVVPDEAVAWMQSIRAIEGTEGKWGGTAHYLDNLIIRSSYTWHDALVRPWDATAFQKYYHPSAVAIRSWIQGWGYQSLSQFRLARDFEKGRRATLSALASYYEHSFGAPNAREAAALIVDNIISASFVIHGTSGSDSSYSEPDPENEIEAIRRDVDEFAKNGAHDAPSTELFHSALLIGSPTSAITEMIRAGALLQGNEPALFYALEHPHDVKALLDSGANVDEGNGFGKTALMYAAHYDLTDTVTLLLARGADVTKRTDGSAAGYVLLQFDYRTALMYAAENASIRVIRELVDAGSDTCAMDSGNRDVWNYVGRNRRLSNDERAWVALLIARKPCALKDVQ